MLKSDVVDLKSDMYKFMYVNFSMTVIKQLTWLMGIPSMKNFINNISMIKCHSLEKLHVTIYLKMTLKFSFVFNMFMYLKQKSPKSDI